VRSVLKVSSLPAVHLRPGSSLLLNDYPPDPFRGFFWKEKCTQEPSPEEMDFYTTLLSKLSDLETTNKQSRKGKYRDPQTLYLTWRIIVPRKLEVECPLARGLHRHLRDNSRILSMGSPQRNKKPGLNVKDRRPAFKDLQSSSNIGAYRRKAFTTRPSTHKRSESFSLPEFSAQL